MHGEKKKVVMTGQPWLVNGMVALLPSAMSATILAGMSDPAVSAAYAGLGCERRRARIYIYMYI